MLTLDLDVEQPYPGRHKTHYDEGPPVLVNTEGALYPPIRDRLRPEDALFDRVAVSQSAGSR